jgi:hypothetical protein
MGILSRNRPRLFDAIQPNAVYDDSFVVGGGALRGPFRAGLLSALESLKGSPTPTPHFDAAGTLKREYDPHGVRLVTGRPTAISSGPIYRAKPQPQTTRGALGTSGAVRGGSGSNPWV